MFNTTLKIIRKANIIQNRDFESACFYLMIIILLIVMRIQQKNIKINKTIHIVN